MRFKTVALTTVLAMSPLLTGCGSSPSSGPDTASINTAASEATALHGNVLRPPNKEPSLTLTDTEGSRYNLAKQGAGKTTLVYFGYTHCPDVCPTTMADVAQALRTVSPAVRAQIKVAFVTVDPHRDHLAVLRKWLDDFNPTFIGLRGTLHHVIAAQRAAGLPPSKVAKNGKTVEHAAQVVAYTPDGLEHVFYIDGPSTIEDLEHDLPILATGQGFGA